MSASSGLFFIVVGPPGVGKNTLMNDALRHLPWLQHLATCTTRSPRPGEQEAGEYHFVTLQHFRRLVADDALLEWQEVHPGRYYGVPRAPVERGLRAGLCLIADLDVLGATCLQLVYPANTVLIFVQPPALQELVARMQARGDSESDIASRIRRVHMELQYAALADHHILNDDLAAAGAQLRDILRGRVHPVRSSRPAPCRHYEARLLINDGARALVRAGDAQPPSRALRAGESPHLAALRCLEDFPQVAGGELLNPLGHAGSFLPPSAVEVERGEHEHRVRLTWSYRLPGISPAPSGWRWQPLEELGLPPTLDPSSGTRELLAAPSA